MKNPNYFEITSFFKDKPHITMNYTPDKVYEGQSVTLCCCSESLTSTIEIWWTIKGLVLSSRYNTNVLCHDIINVSRFESGGYRCFAENEIGIVNDDVIVTVLCKLLFYC